MAFQRQRFKQRQGFIQRQRFAKRQGTKTRIYTNTKIYTKTKIYKQRKRFKQRQSQIPQKVLQRVNRRVAFLLPFNQVPEMYVVHFIGGFSICGPQREF